LQEAVALANISSRYEEEQVVLVEKVRPVLDFPKSPAGKRGFLVSAIQLSHLKSHFHKPNTFCISSHGIKTLINLLSR